MNEIEGLWQLTDRGICEQGAWQCGGYHPTSAGLFRSSVSSRYLTLAPKSGLVLVGPKLKPLSLTVHILTCEI